jgi:hypothetical protein
MSRFRIRRTPNSGPPTGLLFGELAYSDGDQQLYVGRDTEEAPTVFRSDLSDLEQAVEDLFSLPPVYGFTYDQSAEPLAPAAGETWRERSAMGLTLGIWEWSGSLWLGPQKATTATVAVANGPSSTVIVPLDYLGVDSLFVQGVHYCVQNFDSTGNMIIQLRGLKADGSNGAEVGAAFYNSGSVASTIYRGYQALEQLVTAPSVFGGLLGTYTRTLGSGGAAYFFSVFYRNVR